jgi:hypothetical protein
MKALQHEFNQRFDWHREDDTIAKRKTHSIREVLKIEAFWTHVPPFNANADKDGKATLIHSRQYLLI